MTAQGRKGKVSSVRMLARVWSFPPFAMITIRKNEHPTCVDAAREFGVSTKTMHSWIKKGIIGKPPQIEYGVRLVFIFPESYMREARKQVEAHRQQQRGAST